MAKRDYYEVLGVSRDANASEIKRAYRRLAKQFHPDQNEGDESASAKFKEVHEAYTALLDKDSRARYDRFGHAGVDGRSAGGTGAWTGSGQVPIDLGDLGDLFDFGDFTGPGGGAGGSSAFEEFFRGAGARHGTGAAAAAARRDVEHQISLTFDQAVRGTTLEVPVELGRSRRQRISVTIPPGVREGQRIRVRGKGRPGTARHPAGDLYVTCSIQPHPYFERRGDDVYLDVPITIVEATLGAKVDMPTLDGARTVTIPPGTPSGAKLRLAGLGVPSPRGGDRGDHYAVIKIVPPAKLTAEQRSALERLVETGLEAPRDGLWQ